MPHGWEWVLLLLVVLLLFGAKRLPETARGLGRSLRILKAETRGLHDDDVPADRRSETTPATPPAPPQALPPVTPVPPADPAAREADRPTVLPGDPPLR
jgi:sec-independent protein translocase protein TatA